MLEIFNGRFVFLDFIQNHPRTKHFIKIAQQKFGIWTKVASVKSCQNKSCWELDGTSCLGTAYAATENG